MYMYLLSKYEVIVVWGLCDQSCDIAASTSESSRREQEIFVSENSCQ